MSAALDDIKRKLQVRNNVLKNQALSKLSDILNARYSRGRILDDRSSKCIELDLIWDRCSDNCPLISHGMCRILVGMVINGKADYQYVLNGFANRIPSARNVTSLLVSTKDLLMMQMLNYSKYCDSQIVYNLRNPLHPFVLALHHRPVIWWQILEQIKLMFSHESLRNMDRPFAAMQCVLQYIFCNPSRPENLSQLRSSLFTFLLTKCAIQKSEKLEDFLFSTIRYHNVSDVHHCIEVQSRLQDLCNFIDQLDSNKFHQRADDLLTYIVSVCIHMNQLNQDITSCLILAQQLVTNLLKTTHFEVNNCIIVMFASLLLESSLYHQQRIIQICSHLISGKCISSSVSGFLYLPLVSVLSIPCDKIVMDLSILSSPHSEAVNLLKLVESISNEDHVNEMFSTRSFFLKDFCPELGEAQCILNLANTLFQNPSLIPEWLKHALDTLNHHEMTCVPMLCLLFLMASKRGTLQYIEASKQCIAIISRIAQKSADCAPSLLPMMMYLLNLRQEPNLRLVILNSIPLIAVHKVCVMPILKMLKMLSKISNLQALCLRLMCLVWQKEDRVYPHLFEMLKVLDEKHGASSSPVLNEVKIAKAASILEVCKLQPTIYGADLLTSLSKLLSGKCSDEGVPAIALALEGIYNLCDAEVIDLRTTWLFIEQILGRDERPLIICQLCRLLSLAETLKVDTSDYDGFVSKVVARLWHYAGNFREVTISNAAFKALAHFSPSCHRVEYLPKSVQTKVNDEFGNTTKMPNTDAAIAYVPGSAYIELLNTVPDDILQDCGHLISALVLKEVNNMPRHVIYKSKLVSTNRTHRKDTFGLKYLHEIIVKTDVLKSRAEVRSGLATSLLFTFDLPVEVGKDEATMNRSLLQRGGAFSRMLDNLLIQVHFDASDWHTCMSFPEAWGVFIEKTYFAMVETRMVQIGLHQDDVTQDQSQVLKDNAWIWTRDKLCNILKEAARGKPSVHHNAIVALGALVAAVVKYCTLNGDSVSMQVSSEFIGHKQWLQEIVHAFARAFSLSQENPSGPFSWVYMISRPDNALLASVSLSSVLLSEALVTLDSDFAYTILTSLSDRLSCETFPRVQFSLGLGLGLLLSQLIAKHFISTGGYEAKTMVIKYVEKLKSWCDVEDLDSRLGGLLGLAAVAARFTQVDDNDLRSFSATTRDYFVVKLLGDSNTALAEDVLFYCASLITSSSTMLEVENTKNAERLLCMLEKALMKSPNSSGITIAVGLLVKSIAKSGMKNAFAKHDALYESWMTSIRSHCGSAVIKLAALDGIYSLLTGNLDFVPSESYVNAFKPTMNVALIKQFVTLLCQLMLSNDSLVLKNKSFRLAGFIWWNLANFDKLSNEVRTDLSYLNNESVLKPVIQYIEDIIITGQNTECLQKLIICLKSLAQSTKQPFPAINWNALLSPLLSLSEEVQEVCADIAIHQLPSPSSVTLLTSMMIGSASDLLKETTMKKLYVGLPLMLQSVNFKSIQMFLEKCIPIVFIGNSVSANTINCFIKTIVQALEVNNPPLGITDVLHATMVEIFCHITPHEKNVWTVFCEAAVKLPHEIIDNCCACILTLHVADPLQSLKLFAFHCSLVASRKRSISCLKDSLDSVMPFTLNDDTYRGEIVLHILNCFRSFLSSGNSESSGTIACVNWILESMVHLQNVIEKSIVYPNVGPKQLPQVSLTLFTIFAAAVVSWSHSKWNYFCWASTSDKLTDIIISLLPTALPQLISNSNWKDHFNKFADWLIFLAQNPLVSMSVKQCALDCLVNLRDFEEYKNVSIWTRVIEFQKL